MQYKAKVSSDLDLCYPNGEPERYFGNRLESSNELGCNNLTTSIF